MSFCVLARALLFGVALLGVAGTVCAAGRSFNRVTFWAVKPSDDQDACDKRAAALERSAIDGVVIGGGGHHYLHDDIPRLGVYVAAAKRIIKACHAHGIKVAEHHSSVLTTRKDYAMEHRDWLQCDFETGEASVWPEYKTYAFCPNNAEFREHYWKLVRDIMQRTGADALMSDDAVFHHGCCCAACAKRWKDEVGRDIREAYKKSRTAGSAEWRKWNEVRRRWYADFRAWVLKRQRAELPGTQSIALLGSILCAWGTQTHGGSIEGGLDTCDIGIWEAYNPADFYSWRRLSAETAALAEAARCRSVTPLCMPYADTAEKRDVVDREEETFMWALARAYSMPFTLARVFLTGLTDADAPCDYFIFERDRLKPYLNAVPAASVAVFFSRHSRDNDPKWESMHTVPAIAWSEALSDGCIPWRAVTEETLDKGIPKDVRTLIMPNVYCLSDAHLRMIDSFVKRGGRLIATGTPAACEESGDPAPSARRALVQRLFASVDASLAESKAFQDWMNNGTLYHDARDKAISRALAETVSKDDNSQPVSITRRDSDGPVLVTVNRAGRQLVIYILNCSQTSLPEGEVIAYPSKVIWGTPPELTLTFRARPKSVRLISLDSHEDKTLTCSDGAVTLRSPRRFGAVVADY